MTSIERLLIMIWGLKWKSPRCLEMPILQNLQNGRYVNRSRFFRADAHGGVSPIRAGLLNLISRQLRHIRKARTVFARFTA